MTFGREKIIAAWETDEPAAALCRYFLSHQHEDSRRQWQFTCEEQGIIRGQIGVDGRFHPICFVIFSPNQLALLKPDWFIQSSGDFRSGRYFVDSTPTERGRPPRQFQQLPVEPPLIGQHKLVINRAFYENGHRESLLAKASRHLAAKLVPTPAYARP